MVSVATQAFGKALVATIGELKPVEKPELVLLGDVMDMSLAKPEDSARVLKSFFQYLKIGETFGPISFVPGNHDHELWTAERYGVSQGHGTDPTKPDFWAHTSPAFDAPGKMGTNDILNRILNLAGWKGSAATYYPNLGLLPSVDAGQGPRRAVVLHHGHYVESAYKLMTRLLAVLMGRPAPRMTAENLEAANGSWIDFVWSTLGDDGTVGEEVSVAQRLLETGGAAHALQLHLARLMSKQLQEMLPLPHSKDVSTWVGYFSDAMVDAFVGAYSQLERYSYSEYLSEASRQGLVDYIAEVVMAQIEGELAADQMPEHLTFVFGHTHKPFTDRVVVPGVSRPVSVYNTGGWVVDTSHLSTVEGAAVLFIDEQLNTALLHLYALSEGGDVSMPFVTSSDPGPDAENPMFQKLHDAVKAQSAAWESFRQNARIDILIKQDMYLTLGERAERQYLAEEGKL